MRRRLFIIGTAVSVVVFLVGTALWLRSHRVMDYTDFTTETASGHRYWKVFSYRGGFGTKVTDGWPMLWRMAGVASQPLVPSDDRWRFFPRLTEEHRWLGFCVIRGNDVFYIGGRDTPVPGAVFIIPYWAV